MAFISDLVKIESVNISLNISTELLENISSDIKAISSQLDSLINAGYREALLYEREGNISKYRECIIKAIAVDQFNILAQLAYVKILMSEEKYTNAIEQYWDIMNKFGALDGFVPRELVNIYIKTNLENIDRDNFSIKLAPEEADSHFGVTEIWASRNIFVVKWVRPKTAWFIFSNNHSERSFIKCFNIENTNLFEFSNKTIEVLSVTNQFVFLKADGRLICFDYNGNQIENDLLAMIYEKILSRSISYNRFTIPLGETKTVGDISMHHKTITVETFKPDTETLTEVMKVPVSAVEIKKTKAI